MNCGRINKLIYLKETELTSGEIEAVKKHLSCCPECLKEYSDYQKTDAFISALRNSTPALSDEAGFTSAVMERIESAADTAKGSFINAMLDKIEEFFLLFYVRVVSVSFIFLIASTFLLQQYQLLNNVSVLENRMAETSFAFAGSNEMNIIKFASDVYAFIKGDSLYAGLSKNIILTDKTKLDEMLNIYNELQNYRSLYRKEIEEKYPALNSFLNKKLTIEGLQKFVKENEILIKELSRNIPAGGK